VLAGADVVQNSAATFAKSRRVGKSCGCLTLRSTACKFKQFSKPPCTSLFEFILPASLADVFQ
jgi:hypothetical protein